MISKDRMELLKAAISITNIGNDNNNDAIRYAASLILEEVHKSQKQERKHIQYYLESEKTNNIQYAHELLNELIEEHDLELSYFEETQPNEG